MAHQNKVALVTGANKGLGLEIARQLGKQGVTVVISARDAAKGDLAVADLKKDGVDAYFVPLEATDAAQVAALPGFFETHFGRLDILVNNAGVMLEMGKQVTPELLRETFEVNVVAPFAITQALLPLLKAAPAGRIVNHSSILGSLTTISQSDGGVAVEWLAPAYNSSKSALNMLTVIQARQLAGTNVKINAAHPGWVKTDLGGEGAHLEVADGAKTAVELALVGEDGPNGKYMHMGKELPW